MSATVPRLAGLRPGGRDHVAQRVRYVVCDVDGTLIGPEPLASPAVVAAVGRAQAAGIRIGYATGRMRDGVSALHAQLAAEGPHVFHNGAQVRAGGATVAHWPLTATQVDQLLAIAHAHPDVYVEVYGEDGYHASNLDERARIHWELLGSEPRGTVREVAELGDRVITKATYTSFSEEARGWLHAQLTPLGLEVGSAGSPRAPGLEFTNVSAPGATKGAALLAAAAHLGVPLAEVAAIGDAANDHSMLALVGTAIAMGQADASIHAAAHLVTGSVDQDGVATALDALVAIST